MPPRRKRPKKNRPVVDTALKSHHHDDNDIFENELSQPKKQFKRFKAANTSHAKVAANSKVDNTSKHVEEERAMSVTPNTNNDSEDTIIIDTDPDSDFELDIGPKRKRSLKLQSLSPDAKRGKFGDESTDQMPDDNSVKTTSIESDKSELIETPKQTDNDLNVENSDDESIVSNDKQASPEIPPSGVLKESDSMEKKPEKSQNDATENSGAEPIDIELDIHSGAETEVETMADTETQNDSDAENETQKDIPSEGNADVNVGTNSPEEIEFSHNNSNEMENGDDDVLSIFDEQEEEYFGEVEDIEKSPMVRPKKSNAMKMSIPNWKQAEMEKGKKTESNKIELKIPEPKKPEIIRTIDNVSISRNATDVTMSIANRRTIVPDRVVFKVPAQVSIATNRDPRLTRSVTHINNNNIVKVITNDNVNLRGPQAAEGSILSNTNNSQRVSVKDRLGARFNNNQPNTAAENPPKRIFTNLKNTIPIIFSEKPTPTVKTATCLANKINQPISTIPVQKPAPTNNLPNGAQQSQSVTKKESPPPPSPAYSPIMPAFVSNSMQKDVVKLTLPSFATGPQQYEPVFTYLFKRTCRYYILDICQNPNQCELEHRLPDHEYFCKSLDKMFQKSVIALFDEYMCRNQKLFDYYFVDFSKYFGKNNLTENLKKMVEDCTARRVPFHLMAVVEGFMETGQTFTKALSEVISAIHSRSNPTSKEIVKLILNTRIENIRPFIDTLNSIAKQENFKFSNEWINRLLVIHYEKNVPELKDTIWDLINLDVENAANLDPELINKFMDDARPASPQPTE